MMDVRMTKDHTNPFMMQACSLALNNVREGGGPFGCVIVKDGAVLARGVNRVTSTNDPTAHAEVVAIREACAKLNNFQLTGCEIYTSCEPCPMCLSAIYWARPERVYFANTKEDAAAIGFDDSFIYAEIARPIHERKIQLIHMLEMHPVAQEAFKVWMASDKKIKY